MPDHSSGSEWYLAQYKPNCHHIAERNLMQQGFMTFLPLVEETRRLRGRFATRLRPLFPGYLLVSLDRHQGGWGAVNSTYGITRLVSLGSVPTPVPGDLVSALMRRCDRDGRLMTPPAQDADEAGAGELGRDLPAPGDQVMLTRGPFVDFVATIDSLAPNRRVWVLLDLMGAQTRVAIPSDHVRAV